MMMAIHQDTLITKMGKARMMKKMKKMKNDLIGVGSGRVGTKLRFALQ